MVSPAADGVRAQESVNEKTRWRRRLTHETSPLHKGVVKHAIISLEAPVGNIKRTLCSDWLPERARWAHDGLALIPRKKRIAKFVILGAVSAMWWQKVAEDSQNKEILSDPNKRSYLEGESCPDKINYFTGYRIARLLQTAWVYLIKYIRRY